ncbi:MAG: hypothetical protein FWF43_08535 [Propionibacteriaceae bacterium]|nr:hypothetical protein [Propionibacteriaceae bacterium]
MDKLGALGRAAAGALMVILLASCTVPPVSPPVSTPTPGIPIAPSTEASSTPPVTELLADYPGGLVLLGELSSQRGIAELGPFHPSTRSVAVLTRCYGVGTIHVEIPGAAWFDQACLLDPADLGTMNTFDVWYVDSVTVRGSSDNSNLWALAVTEYTRPGS